MLIIIAEYRPFNAARQEGRTQPDFSRMVAPKQAENTSRILVSRIGVRNDNDLVWVGRAANYAAKLSSLDAGYIYITDTVYAKLAKEARYGGDPKRLMWEKRIWNPMRGTTIYRSGWIWAL